MSPECAMLGHDMADMSCRSQIAHCRRGAIALPFERCCEAVEVLVNEGDEVVLLAPYWPSYRQFIFREGGKPVVIMPKGEGFHITPAQLKAAITEKTKWIVLNASRKISPCSD